MNLETIATPWSHDELQLMGAELGDTIDFMNELGEKNHGVIVMLNKMIIYVLTEQHEIIRFGRISLMSLEEQWEIVGLSEKELRISAAVWQKAKNQINASISKEEKE